MGMEMFKIQRTLLITGGWLLIAILLSCHGDVFAQVIIKEKITINPKGRETASGSRTLRADWSRPAGVITHEPCDPNQILPNNIELWNHACGSYAVASLDNGSGSVSVTAVAGLYDILTGSKTVTAGTATLNVFLDGIQIAQFLEPRVAPNTQCEWLEAVIDSRVSLFSDYNFAATNPSILHGNTNTFTLGATETDCSTTVWDPGTDLINLTITTGSELGHLKLGADGAPSSSLLVRSGDVGSVTFIADGRQPKAASEPVTIDAQVNAAGIDHQATFQVLCNLQPTTYRQTDSPWNTDLYDSDPRGRSMSSQGCATTSLCNALSAYGNTVDPRGLNSWMNSLNTTGSLNGYSHSSVYWSQINKDNPYGVTVLRSSNSSFDPLMQGGPNNTPLTTLDGPLGNCELAIVQVYNPSSRAQHWVLVTGRNVNGDYLIIDPAYPDRTTLSNSNYNNVFWGYVIVGAR
jgi:hypothetical protein